MERKLYDLSKLQEIAQGDEAFVKDMLNTFIKNVCEDIENVGKLKVLEDWKTIAGIAHRLVSRFAYLCANYLQALSADIENSVLNENNLTGIEEKTAELCDESILLIEKLKKDLTNQF